MADPPTSGIQFNMAEIHEAIAAAIPDRDCIVFRDRRLSWGEVGERTRRFANALAGAGLGAAGGREGLQGHESHQDHLAIYAYNGNEYLESLIGALKARVAPLNVNYRYVADELRYILADSDCRAIVFHEAFAPTLQAVRDHLPGLELLIEIADGSGNGLLDGAVWYEDLLAGASADLPGCSKQWSPDDLYILYTGGTTGMPRGVLWRQHDIFMNVLGGRIPGLGMAHESVDAIVAMASAGRGGALPTAPFMHGASQWVALMTLHGGGTVVIQDTVDRLDAPGVLSLIERERVMMLQIVGDAFARPLVAAADGSQDLSSVSVVISGGAPLSAKMKGSLLDVFGSAMIVDGLGSSESGTQASQLTMRGSEPTTGDFGMLTGGTVILSEHHDAVVDRGDDQIGWLAKAGDVPLGYLGDAEKTRKTFPVVDGVRYSVPGDRARWRPDGAVEVLGREAATINTGGEKVFAEEVEAALLQHDDVEDVLVCGAPDERWGSLVVAVVQLREGVKAGSALEERLVEVASGRLARYKLPRRFRFVPIIERSPAGKPDYAWARSVAVSDAE